MTTKFLLFLLIAFAPVMAEELTQSEAVLRGNEMFSKNLYKILAEKTSNVFYSPISLHIVLSMIIQGAAEQTLKDLTSVLNIPDITAAADGYQEIMNHLNSIENITLHMANKVYVKENYELLDEFKKIVTDKFLSEVENVDFDKAEAAANTINTWVENKTNKKIKNLLKPESLNHLTRLILVNAIYFKSNWATYFDPKDTKTEKFYINDQQTMDVQMMHNDMTTYFKSDEYLDAKVLELKYTNKDMSMLFILPNKRNGIKELEQKLTTIDLTQLTEHMSSENVLISIPKFKIETKMELKEPLSKLGLGIIFNEELADFSKMLKSPEQLYVSEVIQKAFIEVNEKGSEAAAATYVQMGVPLSMDYDPPPRITFRADHPFIIILLKSEDYKKLVLFQGRILKPTSGLC